MQSLLGGFMMTTPNGNIFRVTGPLCGEFTGPGEFPSQRPVMRSFDVFFDLRLNERLSKQPWGWWFETPSWSLLRQCNVMHILQHKGEDAPYGLCSDENSLKLHDPMTNYTYSRCIVECESNYTFKNCVCIDAYMPGTSESEKWKMSF